MCLAIGENISGISRGGGVSPHLLFKCRSCQSKNPDGAEIIVNGEVGEG
jgi:hypothetical protein